MRTHAVALSFACSLALVLAPGLSGSDSAGAKAADLGGYVVGAGLGLLLGSLLYRNNYPYYNGYSNGYGGSNSSAYQPKVVNGYYWDGYAGGYGPIVVPPPGYVQPNLATSTVDPMMPSSAGAPLTNAMPNMPNAMPNPMGNVMPYTMPSPMTAAMSTIPNMMPTATARIWNPPSAGGRLHLMSHLVASGAVRAFPRSAFRQAMRAGGGSALSLIGSRAGRHMHRFF